MAIAFMGEAKGVNVEECQRNSSRDLIRFNPSTQEYGVLSEDLIVLTYYKARPCASLPHWEPKVNCHGEKDNLTYFRKECAK